MAMYRSVMRGLYCDGFDVHDLEVQSAANMAVARALHDWKPGSGSLEAFAQSMAFHASLRHVCRRYWDELHENLASLLDRPYIAFSDGTRFGCLPWGRLERAAIDFSLVIDGDHAHCTSVPDGCVAVSPSTFDRLIAQPTEEG